MPDQHNVWSQLFDVGKDILTSYVSKATNVILCQIGNALDSTVDADAAEIYFPPGYYGMPANPTPGKPSCQPFVAKQGDRDIILGTRDTRDSQIYGNLKPGERCIAGGYPSQNRFLQKANGDTYIYTLQGNLPGGQSLAWRQGADGSYEFRGAAATIKADASGNITIGNAACGITLSSDGTVKIFGKIVQCQASGVAMVSGDIATIVGPKATVTPANGCAYSVAGPANLISSNVYISI